MLIELKEHDGTTTILFVRTTTVANNFINFFKNNVKISAKSVTETDEVLKQQASKSNDRRAKRYMAEYSTFNDAHKPLFTLVSR